MSSILAIKHFFDQQYGASDQRIQISDYKSSVNISTYEFGASCSLSSIQIPCHLKELEIYYRPSKTPMDFFYLHPSGSRHTLASPMPYEIIIDTKRTIEEAFFDTPFIEIGILNNSFNNKTQFYNVYEDTLEQKEVKWGDYKWLFFYSSKPLISPIEGSPFEKNLHSVTELLAEHDLSLEKIKFNDLFQLKMSDTQSQLLTELILYKTKTEELYHELDKNLPFSIALLQQLQESKTTIFGFDYLDSPIPYLTVDQHIGATLIHKNHFNHTVASLLQNQFTLFK